MLSAKSQAAIASLIAAAVICGWNVGPTHAEWLFKKEDKAFGEIEATAMAVGDASIVFIQCSNGELSINLATPEDWKESSAAMNVLSPKLIMALDGAEPVRFDISLGENGLHKLLAKVDDPSMAKEAAERIAAGKKKLEIGIEFGGKKFHASKIPMAGATKKIQSVLNECSNAADKNDEKKQ